MMQARPGSLLVPRFLFDKNPNGSFHLDFGLLQEISSEKTRIDVVTKNEKSFLKARPLFNPEPKLRLTLTRFTLNRQAV